MAVGRITYNRRRFKLDKRTGRRVPVWRDKSEHLVQTDELALGHRPGHPHGLAADGCRR